MTRTSTSISSLLPTLVIFFSSNALRRWIWVLAFISPISSRKSVPLSAASNLPFFLSTAPVKEPFSWPKSSLSSRLSGRAAQLVAMKGWFRRWLWWWIARATTSLPVPVSPIINTVALVGATVLMSSNIFNIFGLLAMIPSKRYFSSTFRRSEIFSSIRSWCSIKFFMRSSTFSGQKGFST